MAAAADGRCAGTGRWSRGRQWLARRVGGSDRGASVVELAVLAPGLMMLCMLILQFGLWFNARQVAVAAAQAGATVAREEAASRSSWQADAQSAATSYYTNLHSNLLTNIAPRAYSTAGSNVYVTVQGQLGYSVFPFFALNLSISATAGGPIECFRPAGQNGC
ncbi:MAG: TadE family protein [Streptosporangiaceae bacterium]